MREILRMALAERDHQHSLLKLSKMLSEDAAREPGGESPPEPSEGSTCSLEFLISRTPRKPISTV